MAAPHSKLAFKAGICNAIPTKPSLIIRHSRALVSTVASLMGLPRCLNEQAAKEKKKKKKKKMAGTTA